METIPYWLRNDDGRRWRTIKKTKKSIKRKKEDKKWEIILAVLVIVWLVCMYWYTAKAEAEFLREVNTENQVATVKKPLKTQEKKQIFATITAYTSSPDETWGDPFETASGKRTGEGVIACPPKYEFGTKIEIEGKIYTCEDRMHRRYWDEERFDIWMPTKAEAYKWGVKKTNIIAYEP